MYIFKLTLALVVLHLCKSSPNHDIIIIIITKIMPYYSLKKLRSMKWLKFMLL